MTWSTSQLADLVGVSLRTIRHWHDMDLLPEPERLSNNYKQYGVPHLVLALRIHRLSELGFSLEQVREMLVDEQAAQGSLTQLREELESRIGRLDRARDEVDSLLSSGAAPDLSSEARALLNAFGDHSSSLSLAVVIAHLVPARDSHTMSRILREAPRTFAEIQERMDALPAEADEEQILELVDRAEQAVAPFLTEHAEALAEVSGVPEGSPGLAVLNATVAEGLNPAQERATRLIMERFDEE
jgi:DNA-binding transcriptional MerR regulator